MAWGRTPSEALGLPWGRKARWWPIDGLLATALHLVEADKCEGCGQARTESCDEMADGWYEARTVTCHGCAALERARDGAGSAPSPGRLFYTVDERKQ